MGRTIRVIIVVSLVTIALLEVSVRLLPIEKPPQDLFKMKLTHLVQSEAWFPQWQKEHSELRRDFRAYEIYGLEAHPGNLITIDPQGFRTSWNPSPSQQNKVWIFGGSTLWGSFARNDFTIPSEVSKALNLKDGWEVQNKGEIGFVFSQELHRALRLIYSSERSQLPNYIVFFDGVNDVLSAIANHTHGVINPAGLPWEYEKYRNLFQLGKTGEISTLDILKKLKSVRLAIKASQSLSGKTTANTVNWKIPTASELEVLSTQVANQYERMIKLTSSLLNSQGIHPIFVLQPLLAYKATLSPDEKELLDLNREWLPYLIRTYEKMGKINEIEDRSHLFQNHSEELFADILHYSEKGNALIGKEIAEIVLTASKNSSHRLAKF